MNQLTLNILLLAETSQEALADSALLAEECKRLEHSIDAINRQKGGKSCRVIFADGICSAQSLAAFERISKNFTSQRIELEGSGIVECLSAALEHIEEGIFCICRAGSIYSDGTFAAVLKSFAKGAQAVSVKPITKRHTKSAAVRLLHRSYIDYLSKPLADGHIDFLQNPCAAHTAADAYFFSTALLGGKHVEPSLHEEAVHKLLLDILRDIGGMEYLSAHTCLFTTALENDPAAFSLQHHQRWYLDSVNRLFIPLLGKDDLPRHVQYAAVHLLLSKLLCNYGDKDKGLLASKEAVNEFYDAVAQALCGVPNDIIWQWCSDHRWTGMRDARNVSFHRALAAMLLRRKAALCSGELSLYSEGDRLMLSTPDEKPVDIGHSGGEYVEFCVINYENGYFELDGTFSAADLIPAESIELWAEYGGERQKLEQYPIYPLLKCFGVTFAHKYNVHFRLPAQDGAKYSFHYSVNGQRHTAKVHFAEAFSRLVTNKPHTYWVFEKGRCLCCPDGQTLCVNRLSGASHFAKEIKLLCSMLRFKSGRPPIVLAGIAVRCLYWLTRPFYGHKPRWITFDKLYKGGDNGEYFFHYARKRRDGIKTYYIINKSASEYSRLKKQSRNILRSVSLRTMLTALNSEAIVATHSTVVSYLGFPRPIVPIFRDLFNFKVVCIQHGLTVQQLAQYQNRVFDNTTLYCLASKYEHENLMQPIYGFEEKHLKMTGLARFDGLVNDDRRFILITPTWRRNVVMGGIAHQKKGHSDAFKGSEYFRLYNNLINDRRLIECAQRCGYGITYLLHPAMSAQKDDFDKNDYVKIVPATGNMNYEEILTRSSLMVTDYSGVQFDFAYMRKPVVYYHPDTLPPQYESGSIDYPTTGFGPICTEHEQLVDSICEYMENDCRNTPLYIARADSFFAFSDLESCARIYKEVYSFTGHGNLE